MPPSTSDPVGTQASINPADFTFEGGDVKIMLQDGEKVFTGRVCSQSMCLASPVWKKFIFPPWQVEDSEDVDAQEDGGKTIAKIDFREDDCSALLILLNIAHLRLNRIPMTLDAKTLARIALLCEQYQCIKITAPWATNKAWFCFSSKKEKIAEGDMLWAYWTFGKETSFTKMATALTRQLTLPSEEDQLAGNQDIDLENFPPGIKDAILLGRKKLIQDLLDVPYKLLKNFEAVFAGGSSRQPCIHSSPHCNALLYGSILGNLRKRGLWPREIAEDTKASPAELAQEIRSITPLTFPDVLNSTGNMTSHVGCSMLCGFGLGIDRALREMLSPVLASHRRHINA